MFENFEFPLSDLQRWLEYEPDCSDESLSQLTHLLGDEKLATELARAGLRAVFFEKHPRKGLLVDTFTGFHFDRGYTSWWFDSVYRTSCQDDILKAIEYRSKLRDGSTIALPPVLGGLETGAHLPPMLAKYEAAFHHADYGVWQSLLNTLLETRPIPEGLYLGSLEMSAGDPT